MPLIVPVAPTGGAVVTLDYSSQVSSSSSDAKQYDDLVLFRGFINVLCGLLLLLDTITIILLCMDNFSRIISTIPLFSHEFCWLYYVLSTVQFFVVIFTIKGSRILATESITLKNMIYLDRWVLFHVSYLILFVIDLSTLIHLLIHEKHKGKRQTLINAHFILYNKKYIFP